MYVAQKGRCISVCLWEHYNSLDGQASSRLSHHSPCLQALPYCIVTGGRCNGKLLKQLAWANHRKHASRSLRLPCILKNLSTEKRVGTLIFFFYTGPFGTHFDMYAYCMGLALKFQFEGARSVVFCFVCLAVIYQ